MEAGPSQPGSEGINGGEPPFPFMPVRTQQLVGHRSVVLHGPAVQRRIHEPLGVGVGQALGNPGGDHLSRGAGQLQRGYLQRQVKGKRLSG